MEEALMEQDHTIIQLAEWQSERYQYMSSLQLMQERIAELEFASEDFGWTRLNAEAQVEFSRSHLRSMISRARLFFLQNPLIRRGVTLQSDYVFAQGLNIQSSTAIVNEVVQDFLDDPGNQRNLSSHKARLQLEQTQMLDGNVFFVLFTDKVDSGEVKVRTILVDEITDIITNPDDSTEVWFYRREWSPLENGLVASRPKVAYYPDIDYMPVSTFDNAQLPRTYGTGSTYSGDAAPIIWDAPILHVKTGELLKSKFGAPEVYSALDWAQSHKKMLQDWATIVASYARFAFNVKVPGGPQSVAAATAKFSTTLGTSTGGRSERNPPPIAGSAFVSNKDGATLEPIKTAGATTSAKDSRELRIMVAAALGLPDPMLSGEVDVGNLATAKTLDRPTELKFRSRQKLWEDVILRILNWVIRWSIESKNGVLSKYVRVTLDKKGKRIYNPKTDPKTGKPINLNLEVVFPPILEFSIQERILEITEAVTLNGKTFAIDSPELKKMTMRLMLQALGLSDVDERVDLIFAGMDDDELKDNNPDGSSKADPNNANGNNGSNNKTNNDAGTKSQSDGQDNGKPNPNADEESVIV